MTRMTGPDCVVMCNLINTYIHTYIHTYDDLYRIAIVTSPGDFVHVQTKLNIRCL